MSRTKEIILGVLTDTVISSQGQEQAEREADEIVAALEAEGLINHSQTQTNPGGALGYMCKIDFDFELGLAKDGVKIFPSASGAYHGPGCGVVEVIVIQNQIVVPSNLDGEQKDAEELGEKVQQQLKEFDKKN